VARRIQQQRQVPVAWHRQAQCLLQQDLPRGGVEQVGAAHHFGHALCGVIDHHGQLVGPAAIRTAQHEVADLGMHVLLRAAQAITKCTMLPRGTRKRTAGSGRGCRATQRWWMPPLAARSLRLQWQTKARSLASSTSSAAW
jgi:hypothetical protein